MRIAKAGGPMKVVGSTKMLAMPDEVFAGLFICSHDPETLEEVRVWNVRVEQK